MTKPSELQQQLESEMVSTGEKRFLDKIYEAQRQKRESINPASVVLIKGAIEPLAEAIEEEFARSIDRNTRIHKRLFKHLKEVADSKVIAYLTLKAVIDSISTGDTLNNMSVKVGKYIEDELQITSYMQQNKPLMDKVKKNVKKRTTNVKHQRAVLIHSANKAGLTFTAWQSEYRVAIGIRLIDMLISRTGLFEIIKKPKKYGKHQAVKYVIPTKKTLKWLTECHEHIAVLRPLKLPCCDVPKRWTSMQEGGYYGLKNDLIRFVNPLARADYLSMATDSKVEFSHIYDVVNAIQETPWEINNSILEVITHFWYDVSEDVLDCLPPKNEKPIPEFPLENDANAVKKWKIVSTKIYSENIRRMSQKLAFTKTVWVAKKFKDITPFYFPHNLDFRGRVYPIPDFLNPQGDDVCRGLLLFHNKKPVTTEEGRNRFIEYGASLFGHDKKSREFKRQWYFTNVKMILDVANDPYSEGNRWWTEADKPWQFLAWCYEVKKLHDNGRVARAAAQARAARAAVDPLVDPLWDEFKTGLPIMVDGTCNGLQHLSALMKDEVGARAVNLCNTGDYPNDIYQMVADEANRIYPDCPINLDRKLCKRPVMTTPYGSTKYGIRQQIYEELKKRADKYDTERDDWDNWELIMKVSDAIHEAIGKVIVKSRKIMDWLQEIAVLVSNRNWPTEWLSPFGFYVFQTYYKSKQKRIQTQLHGVLKGYKPSLVQSIPDYQNANKNKNAISPNFIHSLDAAHLMMTINDLRYTSGITDIHVVHDCFGVHPDNVGTLTKTLKDNFVEMYENNRILDSFIEDFMKYYLDKVDYFKVVDSRPQPGKFDVREVYDSEFFFS